jgi:hypothetical protein
VRGTNLWRADLSEANLSGANLSGADLMGAQLVTADLSGADLSGGILIIASLVHTDLTGADLTGCHVYGISAWDLKLERTKQQNLVITRNGEPEITVDNIEVAQFIYLMLNNQKIRDVIDTISRSVLHFYGRETVGTAAPRVNRRALSDAADVEQRGRRSCNGSVQCGPVAANGFCAAGKSCK